MHIDTNIQAWSRSHDCEHTPYACTHIRTYMHCLTATTVSIHLIQACMCVYVCTFSKPCTPSDTRAFCSIMPSYFGAPGLSVDGGDQAWPWKCNVLVQASSNNSKIPANFKSFRLSQAAYFPTCMHLFGAPGLGVHGGIQARP